MATVCAKVLKHHLKADGTYNVKIRIFHKNEKRYIDTDHYVTDKQLSRNMAIKDPIISRRVNQKIDEGNFYNPATAWATGVVTTMYPTAGTRYEPSPLSRVVEQGTPGQSWQLGGHTVKIADGANGTEVTLWTVTSTGATGSTAYAANTLYKTTTTDENGNNTIQYKDNLGRIVCKMVQSGATTYLTTNYIYDDFGNLRYVIPPLPTAATNPINAAVAMPTTFTETDNVFSNYIYGYHYDNRNRLIEKKVPGKTGWEYIVYNTIDQPILTQDPNQLSKGIWMATQYDALGRVVMTGEYASSATRSALQIIANSSTNLWESFTNVTTNYGYTHVTSPDISSGAGNKVLTVSFYDNYSVITNTAVNPGSSVFVGPSVAVDTLDQVPCGVAVATLVNVLSTSNYIFSVTHYDKNGRVVKIISENYVGGSLAYNKYDTEEKQYSFQSIATQSIRKHYLPASSTQQLTIYTWKTYDHMNRPLLTKQQYITQTTANGTVTGSITTLSKIDYNELSQVLTKHLHSANNASSPVSSTFLQHVDYRYNERGWLTMINNPANMNDQTYPTTLDVFSEQLDYDQSNNGYTGEIPMYNGNISSVKWQTKLPAALGIQQEQKGFLYTYDPLNRLTNAASQAAVSGANLYNEALTYDELGNILTLVRSNVSTTTPLNSLKYNYTTAGGVRSNQLLSITDNGTVSETQASTYTYNANGSVITDTKRTITTPIVYNELGLPSLVTINTPAKTLTYNYDATGKKLERITKLGATVTDDRIYDDGIEYDNNAIEFVHAPEGRAVSNLAGGFVFQYAITDHLGNTRAVITDANGNGVLATNGIVQMTDYYTFGREIAYSQSVSPSPDNKYKYNGKEFQFDLGEYDYGARFYDPVIGRWNVIDPMAEISRRWSPYSYVENNPVENTDPDGMVTIKGAYGETQEVSSADHYSADGDLTVNGQAYSRKGFQAAMPDVAAGYEKGEYEGKADAQELYENVTKEYIRGKDGTANSGGLGMSLTESGLKLIKFHELWVGGDVYIDPNGHRTIGYGHLVEKGESFGHLSYAQGLALLAKDAQKTVNAVNSLVKVKLTQTQFDSMVDFAFNINNTRFGNSTLLQDLNAGHFDLIRADFMQWTDHGAGYAIRRREDDIELFYNGKYVYR